MNSSRFTQHSLVTEAHKTLIDYQPTAIISLDATAGNGHDSIFLAQHSEKLYAFDIQKIAIDNTRQRLEAQNLIHKAQLIHANHQHLADYIPTNEKIDIAMFNLGYLPHIDEDITTQKSSTLSALNTVLTYLNKGGIISILAYQGHHGGADETQAILNWSEQLNPQQFNISHIHSQHEKPHSPRLMMIQAS